MIDSGEKNKVGILEAQYKLPPKTIKVRDLLEENRDYIENFCKPKLLIPKLKEVDFSEIGEVHGFQDEKPGELVLQSIEEVLKKRNLKGSDISLIIDYSTTSRDENGLSLCYKIQGEIGADQALVIALGNGSCSSFQIALKTASVYFKCLHHIKHAILFSEDRVEGSRVYFPSNIVGDGASVLLLGREDSESILMDTETMSIGKFHSIMGIRHGHIRNFDVSGFEQRVIPMHYKVVNDLVGKVLESNCLSLEDIDHVLYQNMNINDYMGLIGSLRISKEKVFLNGLKGTGHIFGADLVVNYCRAKGEGRFKDGEYLLMISSGAGFLWGVSLLKF
ncbi:MAG: hypothetical protein N2645_08280 [Clostridia bacterium]|nr:hypothetical protein [Clostridia bacterium]